MRRAGASSYRGWWLKFIEPAGWRGQNSKTNDLTPPFIHKKSLLEYIDEIEDSKAGEG